MTPQALDKTFKGIRKVIEGKREIIADQQKVPSGQIDRR
jgi:hypothetical protein